MESWVSKPNVNCVFKAQYIAHLVLDRRDDKVGDGATAHFGVCALDQAPIVVRHRAEAVHDLVLALGPRAETEPSSQRSAGEYRFPQVDRVARNFAED